jgi:RNA polymerase sigma-70 factor (ECF subfamily)
MRQALYPEMQPQMADALPGTGSPMSALSFRLTVLRHYRSVYRMAAALLNDPSEAEDVTQETFTRYWQLGDSIKAPAHWLLRVARNACLDRLRTKGRYVRDHDTEEEHDTREPAWHYQQADLARHLRRALDELPEPQRSLIYLFDIQGHDGRSCAEILELSENQVKVYLHRARRRLRLALESHNDR